jgi:arginase
MGAAPPALRKTGLVRVLGPEMDYGDIDLPRLEKDLVEGKVKNLNHFKECTSRVYRAARSVQAERVFVVGGECSETVGSMAGLTEAFGGKAGMLWMDAHGDFNTPSTSPSGYIGGMALAFACGRGPNLGEEIERHMPIVAEESLVHVGSRALDPPEVLAFNSSPAKLFTAQQVKKSGAAEVGQEAARHLENRSDWIVCHLDVDVIDPSEIPAVSYPTPGGLTVEEAKTVVQALVRTEKLKVFELCSYNAAADRAESSAKTIVKLVKNVFQ